MPTSSVAPLPASTTAPSFIVSWTGQDDPGGSGIASYDVDVSDDGGAFTLWQNATTATSATYSGVLGHTYAFYSVATDNVGHVEETPVTAEARTTLVPALSVTSIAAVSPNPRNAPVSTIDVTLSEPVSPGTFTPADLALTDNGGSNRINSGVRFSSVSGSTYRISGLAALTRANGVFTLTVDATGVQDQYGNPGTNALSTSWLMDTALPVSAVNPLPKWQTGLDFTVSIAGSDPGATPSGITSFAVEVSTNGGPWRSWTTVPASSPSAVFHGQSNTLYAFHAIAHDLAGNVEAKKPAVEASTYVPDVTAPVTAVNGTTGASPTAVDPGTATFTLNTSGTDVGGSGLAYAKVWVSVDAQPPVEIGPPIPRDLTMPPGSST